MNSNVLLYFVKYPEAGKVKSRLAKTVGDREAARLYKELAERNFQEIRLLSEKNVCDVIVAFDPPRGMENFEKWLSGARGYRPQCEGGLGERLAEAFREAFQKGARRVMALGSDTLGLTTGTLRQGFEALAAKDVVIGPAEDGGYYLIGSASFQPKLFEGIAWSTSDVLPQTYKTINNLRLSYQTLSQLQDLDEIKIVPTLSK
ncbi:MAG TPA: hypothetical protein DE315_04215 [Candidatus Omnitrophica bacterium]|nr:MAG: hypothetical protein A2Y05_04490 [Omnitrophica WOR_2 bacterium GWA2_53_43]HBO97658.1 hypothetical protein [Candidatus Omnitrophota bacterium]HCI44720.1 hypothetical protein [Candidatus Omnitrophota bacterium]